ncbi:MAG: RluA family pseudouridine synthase [Clostridiales bacterium]|nr:RluA family pseudouridine synthase [Clostridiales bacterium]
MGGKINYELKSEDESLYISELMRRRLGLSSRLMRKLKVSGEVLLNGEPARLKEKGRAGDLLCVVLPRERSYFEPCDIALDIRYEDLDLLIINKQPGLVMHPTKNYQSGTLANALAHRMEQRDEFFKVHFVNRLDRDSSGLVVAAKNSHAHNYMAGEMAEGRTEKKYIAAVHGILEGEGEIDAPLGKEPGHKARRCVIEGGYPSRTLYRSLEIFKAEDDCSGRIRGYSLVELTLLTGRTHQIRAHLAHIGHPIVGDELYGQLFGYGAGEDLMNRQALHACSFGFSKMRGGEYILVEAPLPEDMKLCIERMESLSGGE